MLFVTKIIQRNFGQNHSIYVEKVKGFGSISVDLYIKTQRTVARIGRFTLEKVKEIFAKISQRISRFTWEK